jgi:hypothetical protein
MATMIRMAEEDLNALRAAVATLEHPALAAVAEIGSDEQVKLGIFTWGSPHLH